MNAPVLSTYDPNGFYCEMTRSNANHGIRDRLGALSVDDLKQRAAEAEAELHDLGITFTVYSDKDAIDRILPFDVDPARLSAAGVGAYRARRDPARHRAQPVCSTISITSRRSSRTASSRPI